MDTTIDSDTLKAINSLSNEVIPKKKRSKKNPVDLNDEEFAKLLKSVKKPHHRLAFALAFNCGLRISEVVKLKPEDINLKSRNIAINDAKGGKNRIVPLPKGFQESNLKLLPVKCGIRALEIAFIDHCKKAGVYKEGLVFHSLRRSFAVRCLSRGMPLNSVQNLLGHENISTTSIYTNINSKHAIDDYEKFW